MPTRVFLLLGATLTGLARAQTPVATPLVIPGGQREAAADNIEVHQQHSIEAIEIHTAYAAPIGTDTGFLQVDGSKTKWIGVNTEYLTQDPHVTKVNNVETTVVVKQPISVVTAAVDSEGIKAGDVTVLLADKIQKEVDAIVKDAAASCNAAPVLRKRAQLITSILECRLKYAQQKAEDDLVLSDLNADGTAELNIITADTAPAILTGILQILKNKARKKFILLYAGILVTAAGIEVAKGTPSKEPLAPVPHKLVFSEGKVGQTKPPEPDQGLKLTSLTSETSASTQTSSGCRPEQTGDENSPACDDVDCLGMLEKCQAPGKNRNCPCNYWMETVANSGFEQQWGDFQQMILEDMEKDEDGSPQCEHLSSGTDFEGHPNAEPNDYCVCRQVVPDSTRKRKRALSQGAYPTLPGQGDAVCAYTAMPSQTISIKYLGQEGGSITSCRVVSDAVPTPTCTCNDNQGHNLITKTFAGAVRTFCPDAPPPGLPQDGTCSYPLPVCRPKNVRKCSNPLPVCAGAPKSSAQVPVGAPPTAVAPTTAVPKASDIGLPTTDPMCYNSPPPPPHNDPNRDQVIKLCGIKDDDLARVCKSNWHPKDPASSPNGPGIAPMDCHPDPGAAQIDPVNSNVYKAKFVLAENTQPDCGFIFGNNATDDATLERVPPLCVPAFSAIRDKCPWSGGEVKNGCGTFYYWSCPKENQGCLPGQG